ncbi:hypothetical protein BV25DRAFT_1833976 [Artomyces pyxidatus]|uniref:Uncharacterized protein n=1 Tax=Artomyces pyxidatus TaxID=48021 RepID=A0ACB8TK63_9AGAM|nr:hypothetical protein BV25DRAFT_1833976 [Artomyces pyxidatus]
MSLPSLVCNDLEEMEESVVQPDSDDMYLTGNSLASSPALSIGDWLRDSSSSPSPPPMDIDNLVVHFKAETPHLEYFGTPQTTVSPVVGLYPDFNMYDLASNTADRPTGIDPARLVASGPTRRILEEDTKSPLAKTVPEVLKLMVWKPSPLEQIDRLASSNHICQNTASSAVEPAFEDEFRMFVHSPDPTSSVLRMEKSSYFSRSPRKSGAVSTWLRTVLQHSNSVSPSMKLDPSPILPATTELREAPPSPDTPIFDAHLGVDLRDLQHRANRYRRRYPGAGIDRSWLLLYAGKTAKDGSSTENYRCYVSGCSQTNKRRDHMVVHVGSHVGERPFVCNYCKMRFLRRNECKRHEANHSGEKPYTCDRCSPVVKFGRQDLLTRHMRRMHGEDGVGKDRKRSRVEEDDNAGYGSEDASPVRKRKRLVGGTRSGSSAVKVHQIPYIKREVP